MTEKAFRLDLQYRGEPFLGWQDQPDGITVQGSLEKRYSEFLGVPVSVDGSGRTDTGVHARHQVAVLRAETDVPARAIQLGILPYQHKGIHVFRAAEVAPDWRPRPALSREYRYFLWKTPDPPLFYRPFAAGTPSRLDLDRMRAAAAQIPGERDFSSFQAAGCTAKHPIRRVERVEVLDRDSHWEFRIIGNAFLRQMVRILVGTLVEAGRGRLAHDGVSTILERRDRSFAGPTLPPQGLFLWRIVLEAEEIIEIPPLPWG